MSHKKRHHKKKKDPAKQHVNNVAIEKLELVIKCDTSGCVDAVRELLKTVVPEGFQINIIHKGVGDITKNDALIAETGSSLIIGFNVKPLPSVEEFCKSGNVEIRLYDVIYKIGEDIKKIISSLAPQKVKEESLGIANVIALFKSCRGGIILGCEIKKGRLQTGDKFKVISAMGPIHNGIIQSLHIGKDAVKKANLGQQVGLKIVDFNTAKIGDIVESYQISESKHASPWTPRGGIIYP